MKESMTEFATFAKDRLVVELRIRKNIAKQLSTYFLDYLRYRIDDSFRATGYLEPKTPLISSSYRFDRFIERYEFMIELADMVLPQTPGGDQC